ncbi:MAG TPA: AraC family transcriptional regulator [Bradyrhizobium sp.]
MIRFEQAATARSNPVSADAFARDESTTVLADEPAWRVLPSGSTVDSSVIATRWRGAGPQPSEVHHETPRDRHLVMVVMNTANIRFSVNGITIHDGVAMPGMFHVTEPDARVSCLFRGAHELLHLHVPNALIEEYDRTVLSASAPQLSRTGLRKDQMVERLARALLEGDQIGGTLGGHYTECLSAAIVMRLLTSTERAAPVARPRVAELARWRLRRAIEFVETNLVNSISSSDIAAATGLTRMHFAAQFKAATGLRPHEYLLRRRVERGQEMLLQTDMSVVEIALSVGFQSQSHFTVVFNRFVGRPPHAWRQLQGNGGDDRRVVFKSVSRTRARPLDYAAAASVAI